MKSVARVLGSWVLGLAMVVSVVGVPAQAAGPDVYSTPGGQKKDGSLYKTSCEKQSNDVVRCKTEKWGSVVRLKKGKYVTDKGWHLTRYTYLPSVRSKWKKSPYAAYGKKKGKVSWKKDGKKYRSECDTKKTGKGACRTYVWTTTISKSKSGKYVKKSDWKLNRVVKFAENGAKKVTKVPKHVLDQSVLTAKGLGPLKLGAKYRDLEKLGYMRWHDDDYCAAGVSTSTLEKRDIFTSVYDRSDGLDYVAVRSPRVRTAAGAHVGMTVQQILDAYGARAVATIKDGNGGPFYVVEVVEGATALVFMLEEWAGPDWERPSDMSNLDMNAVIGQINVMFHADGYYGGC